MIMIKLEPRCGPNATRNFSVTAPWLDELSTQAEYGVFCDLCGEERPEDGFLARSIRELGPNSDFKWDKDDDANLDFMTISFMRAAEVDGNIRKQHPKEGVKDA
jgi:hypothetical protein